MLPRHVLKRLLQLRQLVLMVSQQSIQCERMRVIELLDRIRNGASPRIAKRFSEVPDRSGIRRRGRIDQERAPAAVIRERPYWAGVIAYQLDLVYVRSVSHGEGRDIGGF